MKNLSELINSNPETYISISDSIVNIFLATLVAFTLKFVYEKCELASKSEKSLSNNFVNLTLITVFIISVIKSSLALSLGLVGALSIVRFRTAIKEPTELIYLFFCIAIGLGFGANLPLFTISVTFLILFIIVISHRLKIGKLKQSRNIFIEIELEDSENALSTLMKEIGKYTDYAIMVRHDFIENRNMISLESRFANINDIDYFKSSKWFKSNVKSFSFFESKGMI